jgi:hypothetical protein
VAPIWENLLLELSPQMAGCPPAPSFGFSAVKRPPYPKECFEILKEMIALDMDFDPTAEMPGLRIGTC